MYEEIIKSMNTESKTPQTHALCGGNKKKGQSASGYDFNASLTSFNPSGAANTAGAWVPALWTELSPLSTTSAAPHQISSD